MGSIDDSPKVRIAILGGGLAGVTVFNGLSRHKRLIVDIFESAPVFREQGQAVTVREHAAQALDLLGLHQCLHEAGAVRTGSLCSIVGQGPNAGVVCFDTKSSENGVWSVQRAALLTQLLKEADTTRMHTGRKLKVIKQCDEEIELLFEDGSTFVCDILIGADGIHSTVRKYVLGFDNPATNPKFAGWWTVWTLVPFEKAQQHLGSEYMSSNNPVQYCWSGNGVWVMHDQLSDNQLTQCVIAQRVPEDSVTDASQWMKTISKDELHLMLKDWHPSISQGMYDLITDTPNPIPMFSLWHHMPVANTYVKDGVALVGDAADATSPWMGCGGGMAMEDAYIISTLFGNVKTVAEAKRSILAYEKVNKPRRQRLVRSSYEIGLIFSGCDQEVGIDPAKLKEALQHRWDWILDVDLRDHSAEALNAFNALRVG